MIYKNCLGALEYKASISIVRNGLSSKEVKTYSHNGEKIEIEYPYFVISALAEGFPLTNKRYAYSNKEEYLAKIEECISDMRELGFSVSSKRPSIFGAPFVSIDFVHDETKAAAEKEKEKARSRRENGEKGYIRFGDIPESGKSYNYRDNFYEEGVSAYHAIFYSDGDYEILAHNPFEMYGMRLYSNRPVYRLYGEEIGTGSDGEPILRVDNAVKLDERKDN